jgi:hypothetical protein
LKSKKDILVSEYLERVGGDVLESEHYRSIVAGMIKGHAGVYALYKDERLYYVGLATNLMGRVKHHLKDRHTGKWNRFSVYLANNDGHIKPLESLLLRIINPTGNRVKGRLAGARDLKKELNNKVAAHHADERARLLGGALARNRRRRKAASGNGTLVLAGSVERRMSLRADYKGYRYTGTLRKDGHISYDGNLYKTPTAAAKAVVGRTVNGWQFWHYKNGSQWVPLSGYRK